MGVAIDPAGNVYVVDGGYKKIVVFSANAQPLRVIMGGYGKGPGEFVTPLYIDVDRDGDIYVLDIGLARITVFNGSGIFQRTIAVGGAHPVSMAVVSPNEIWLGLSSQREPSEAVMVLDSLGKMKSTTMRQTDRDFQFSRYGDSGMLGTIDGRPVLATVPGFWLTGDSRIGVDLIDGAEPYVVTYRNQPMAVNPAGSRGLVELGSRRLAYFYYKRSGRGVEFPVKNCIAIFGIDGRLLASGAMTVTEKFRNPASNLQTSTIYIGVHNPYPHVVAQRVEIDSDRRSTLPAC